jgi:DHA2 family multidrug resistance protein
MTTERPFLPIALIKDRNFVTATMFGFAVGLLMFATLALLPPMLETLMGYPVVTTGLVTMPRGVGSLLSMFLVGRMINRVDTRVMVGFGLVLSSLALLGMSQFNLTMDARLVVSMGLLQGIGIGLVFVPLTTLGFATLDNRYRADGAGVFTLMRNLGASAGISIMQALLTHNTQVVQSRLTEGLRADNPALKFASGFGAAGSRAIFSLTQPGGVAALEAEVGRQASMVAYIDNFRLMFFMGIVIIPLLLVMSPPKRNSGAAAHIAVD